jgi:hypothetical protein
LPDGTRNSIRHLNDHQRQTTDHTRSSFNTTPF